MFNTKGCCFLYLESVSDNQGNVERAGTMFPLQELLRYFHIDGNNLTLDGSGGPSETPEINVELCKTCKKNCERLSIMFQRLEKVQLEINYFLEQTHNRISESNRSPELLDNYSRKMTSDVETITQLNFVDTLRTKIAKRSLKLRVGHRPQIELIRAALRPNSLCHVKNEDDVDSNDQLKYEASNEIPSQLSDLFPELYSEVQMPLITLEETKFCPPTFNSLESNCVPAQTNCESNLSSASLLKSSFKAEEKTKPTRLRYRRFLKDPLTGRYPCPSCDKAFGQAKGVRIHFQNIHEGKVWKCEICNVKNCNNPSNLRKHRKRCLKKQHLPTVRPSGEVFANQQNHPAHFSNTMSISM